MNTELLFGFFVSIFCHVVGQTCDSGSCISLMECPELLSIVSRGNNSPAEVERLKRTRCGFEGTTPKVCCPTQCYTPEGKPGKCISIYECPHIASLLKPPLKRDDNLNYVQNSKCKGSDMYSVCCGPPRDFSNNINTKCRGEITAFPPDPKSKCCGQEASQSNRITGGNVTALDQFPWLVLIEYSKDGGPVTTMCGGALISGRYVLTAAHCLTGSILDYGEPINVRLSEYNTKNPGPDCAPVGGGNDCTDGSATIGIEESIPHPEYNLKSRHNDIGLIRLKQSAPYTDFIRPICLPSVDETQDPSADYVLNVAGWGAVSESKPFSNIKLYVDVPYVAINNPYEMGMFLTDMAFEECQGGYQVKGRRASLWERQLCAGGETGKDSCRGDSGGPLMLLRNQSITHEAIGVVSFGPVPCGLPNVPGVYTKVISYNDWIRKTIKA